MNTDMVRKVAEHSPILGFGTAGLATITTVQMDEIQVICSTIVVCVAMAASAAWRIAASRAGAGSIDMAEFVLGGTSSALGTAKLRIADDDARGDTAGGTR